MNKAFPYLFGVAIIALSIQTSQSFSLLTSKAKKTTTSGTKISDTISNLNKKSTALDVLQSLNKNSRLASYVTNNFNRKQQPIAVVTGGSSGIGIPSVETLALAGIKVILCARNVTAATKVIRDEIPTSIRSNIHIQELDLSDMSSIQKAANEIIQKHCKNNDDESNVKMETECDKIDILLNNAGVMAPPQRTSTAQGLELQFGTNHVGHHMFTRLLLPYMNDEGRVVTVASTAHEFGQLDFSNLNYEDDKTDRGYSAWGAYGQSKLANILFAKGLSDKLKDNGSAIRAVSLHPGVIATNLWRHSPKWAMPFLNAIVADKNVQQGAATNVFSCLVDSSEFKGGEYLKDCGVVDPNSQGQDELGTLRGKLWDATEEMIREKGFEMPSELL